MGDLKNYIDNGIPISYMIILKMGKLFKFFHGCLIKLTFLNATPTLKWEYIREFYSEKN